MSVKIGKQISITAEGVRLMAQRLAFILSDEGNRLQPNSRAIVTEVLEKMELVYVQMKQTEETLGVIGDELPAPKRKPPETADELIKAALEAHDGMPNAWLCLLVVRLGRELARYKNLLEGTRAYSSLASRDDY